MDRLLANKLYQLLKDKNLSKYQILDLINNGKSAAVFKATDESGTVYALKIFDNDLIEKFGLEIQTKRIEQELSLINHGISNLVQIIDGGTSVIDGVNFYFIVMEFLEGENLKDYINNTDYDIKFILKALTTLKTVTDELLIKGIAHRDLKPENIMVSKSGQIILMDLGVLKYIGVKSLTDDLEKQFLGTLRYAPPEYLMRLEEDSLNGWRSVNLYQIGGVLHDLIVKKELFYDKHPYANLVIAIKEDAPTVTGSYDYELLQLTRDLLTKDWRIRLQICSDERIRKVVTSVASPKLDLEKELSDLNKLKYGHQLKFEEIQKLQRSESERHQKRHSLYLDLRKVVSEAFQFLQEKNVTKSIQNSNPFTGYPKQKLTVKTISNGILYVLTGDLSMGYPKDLVVICWITNNESNYCNIQFLALFPGLRHKVDLHDPPKFLHTLKNPSMTGAATRSLPDFFVAFEGTFELDEDFKKLIKLKLIQLIKSALYKVENTVREELEKREKALKENKPPSIGALMLAADCIYINTIIEH